MWLLPPLLLVLAAPLWLHTFEPALFLAINAGCAGIAAPLWTGLSLLGNGWGLLAVLAPLLVLAPRLLWAGVCAAPFAAAFARIGKGLIVSPRPAAVVDNAQMRIIGETLHNVSMPSGHTLTAFAVATAIYLALPAAGRWRHGWLFVLAAGTGLSRIAVGAHWPGDVAVGASLGLLAGMLGHRLLVRMDAAYFEPGSGWMRLLAGLLLVCLWVLLTQAQDFDENWPLQYALAPVVALSLVVFVWQNVQARRGC